MTRSRWRESSTTSRRAASSRSTVRTWSGSAWRTAAVSTAGRPAASARASRWAACERHPGVPSGPPWCTTSTASPSRGQQRLPGREEVAGPLAAPGEHRPADVGVGAEQHEQPARLALPASTSVRLDPRFHAGLRAARTVRKSHEVGSAGWDQVASRSGLVTGTPRSPRRWVSVTSRHSAAQPTPGGGAATPAPGEHGDPGPPGVDDRAPAHRGARARTRATGIRRGPCRPRPAHRTERERLDGEVDAEHRRDAGPAARRGEPDRAVEPVAVGEREGALAVLGGALDEVLGHRGAVAHREPRGDVEVGEPVHRALRPSGRGPAAAAGAPPARRGGPRRGRRRSRRRAAGRRPRGR